MTEVECTHATVSACIFCYQLSSRVSQSGRPLFARSPDWIVGPDRKDPTAGSMMQPDQALSSAPVPSDMVGGGVSTQQSLATRISLLAQDPQRHMARWRPTDGRNDAFTAWEKTLKVVARKLGMEDH